MIGYLKPTELGVAPEIYIIPQRGGCTRVKSRRAGKITA